MSSNIIFRIAGIKYKMEGRAFSPRHWDKSPGQKIFIQANRELNRGIGFEMDGPWGMVKRELDTLKEAERLRKWRATMKARYGK